MSPMLSLVGGGAEGVGCWHAVARRTARKAANKINLPVKSLSITLYFLLVLLLPIKVYLASVAVALLAKNRLEWARQTFVVSGYIEYSFLLRHTVPLPRLILA